MSWQGVSFDIFTDRTTQISPGNLYDGYDYDAHVQPKAVFEPWSAALEICEETTQSDRAIHAQDCFKDVGVYDLP